MLMMSLLACKLSIQLKSPLHSLTGPQAVHALVLFILMIHDLIQIDVSTSMSCSTDGMDLGL